MSEFNLMPFQDLPFNGDFQTETEFLKLRDKFNIKIAIETGSCLFTTSKANFCRLKKQTTQMM